MKNKKALAFTLTELIISLLIFAIIGMTAILLLRSTIIEYSIQSDIIEAEDKALHICLLFEKKAIHAGLGIPESWDAGTFPAQLEGQDITSPIFIIEKANIQESEAIALTYTIDGGFVLKDPVASGDTDLNLTWDTTLYGNNYFNSVYETYFSTNGLKSYITFPNQKDMFYIVQNITTGTEPVLSLQTPITTLFDRFTPVLSVRCTSFFVDNNNIMRIDDNLGDGAQPLERGIEIIRFKYDQPNKILYYWFLIRGKKRYQNEIEAGKSYPLDDGVYTIQSGQEAAHYRHILVRGSIKIRN